MATPNISLNLSGFARRLVVGGLVNESDAFEVSNRAREEGKSFLSELLAGDSVDTGAVCLAASHEFGIPIVDLETIDWDNAPVDLIPEKLVREHIILPLHKRSSKLFVAVSDPSDSRTLNNIKFHTGLGIEPILADKRQLDKIIDVALDMNDTSLADMVGDDSLDDLEVGSDAADDQGVTEDQIDTPIVRFVNKIIVDAIKQGASDIHIEPYEKRTRVRFRVDGMLHEVASPPPALTPRVIARIKILSALDIAERRIPQDGRMKIKLSKSKTIDFRVSTLPTLFGEKCVIRVLDTSAANLELSTLGMEEDQLALYSEAIKRPYGMILVTGPTGSGKTVSLYSALRVLNTPGVNIASAEDPVEINVEGINQVNVNVKANLTFATALRSFLRQDPDIVMVGEIRDLETAEIAIKAAQTGHLVLSTLHTNDAPATLTRLLNMGVAAFNVASSVHLIMAQRLCRRLCEACKQPADVPDVALLAAGFKEDDIGNIQLFEPVGCGSCTGGYKGRTGIYEVMPISDETTRIMLDGGSQLDIEEQARREGVRDLRESGLLKAKAGITSLAEIERVTNM